jgi:hypothetical protein
VGEEGERGGAPETEEVVAELEVVQAVVHGGGDYSGAVLKLGFVGYHGGQRRRHSLGYRGRSVGDGRPSSGRWCDRAVRRRTASAAGGWRVGQHGDGAEEDGTAWGWSGGRRRARREKGTQSRNIHVH